MNQDREEKIAELIRAYSNWDVDRKWLFDKSRDKNNVFKRSFHDINDYINDEDLALWYLAFGQSFGRRTDVMHSKMAKLCTADDLELITFKKDLPSGCPYIARKDAAMKSILDIDFSKSNKEIINEISTRYRPEKFYHEDVWCWKEAFDTCQYKDECPVHDWKKQIGDTNHKLPYRTAPKICFYYDTLCLLNNSELCSFDQLFSKLNKSIADERYLFSWDNVPGSESERLIRYLKDDWGFDWVKKAKITKINGNRIIQIHDDKNRAHIVLDENKEKATLTINKNGKHLDLLVKSQNGKLNVYKRCIFYDVCPKAKS
jgi:hypothetical protein